MAKPVGKGLFLACVLGGWGSRNVQLHTVTYICMYIYTYLPTLHVYALYTTVQYYRVPISIIYTSGMGGVVLAAGEAKSGS